MDLDKVFSLFESNSEDTEKTLDKQITNLSDHPYILVGLFTRMILKGQDAMLESMPFLSILNPDADLGSVRNACRVLIYRKGYEYLSKVSLDNRLHCEVLLDFDQTLFKQACTACIEYFSEVEEYEKCAFIKKFIDFINFSENKLPC